MHNNSFKDLGKDKYGRRISSIICANGEEHFYVDGVIQKAPPDMYNVYPPEWKTVSIGGGEASLPETVYVHKRTGYVWKYIPEF